MRLACRQPFHLDKRSSIRPDHRPAFRPDRPRAIPPDLPRHIPWAGRRGYRPAPQQTSRRPRRARTQPALQSRHHRIPSPAQLFRDSQMQNALINSPAGSPVEEAVAYIDLVQLFHGRRSF